MWKLVNHTWLNLRTQQQQTERPPALELLDTIYTVLGALREKTGRKSQEYKNWLNDLYGRCMPCLACGGIVSKMDKDPALMNDYELFGASSDHPGCPVCRGDGWVCEADTFSGDAVRIWAKDYPELVVVWSDIYQNTGHWRELKVQTEQIHSSIMEETFSNLEEKREDFGEETRDRYQEAVDRKIKAQKRKERKLDAYFERMMEE